MQFAAFSRDSRTRISARATTLLLCLAASCSSDSPPTTIGIGPASPFRLFNTFASPVDVLIDGRLVVGHLASGGRLSGLHPAGAHTFVVRPSDGGASVSRSITIAAGVSNTLAVVRLASGSIDVVALDDANSVVPAGATRVRVLHLALKAGTLQVYRTQPDNQTPASWLSPFEYQPDPTRATSYLSTAGDWQIRVWTTPADPSGWSSATTRVTIPLASGEKKTVVILDGPFGGIVLEQL